MKRLIVICALTVSLKVQAYQEITCLAQTIYREARGEPLQGKLAVGQVLINRAKNTSLCKALHEPGQFQWIKRYPNTLPDVESYLIARQLLTSTYNFKATHFHNKSVKPKWRLKKIAIIGNHIFYAQS